MLPRILRNFAQITPFGRPKWSYFVKKLAEPAIFCAIWRSKPEIAITLPWWRASYLRHMAQDMSLPKGRHCDCPLRVSVRRTGL